MKHLNLLVLTTLAILFLRCNDISEKDPFLNSNINSIDDFGIYLLEDSIKYQDVIADTSAINVFPEPFISLKTIDYYEITSHSIHLKEPIESIGLYNRPYVIIADGQILAIGAFYFTRNCCYPVAGNALIITGLSDTHSVLPVNNDQRKIFQSYLSSDKIKEHIITHFESLTKETEDSLRFQLSFTNNSNEGIYILDPAKTPNLYNGYQNDIFFSEYFVWPESFKQAILPGKFTDENYTFVQAHDTLRIILDQKAFSHSSLPLIVKGNAYDIRFYYNSSSEIASINPIWQNIIIHSQKMEVK